MNHLRKIYASVWAAVVSVVFSVVVTIVSELSPEFMNWLKAISGHHWKTKSFLSILVFFACYFLFLALKREVDERVISRGMWILVGTALTGTIVITGFFVWFYLVV